jgi:prolyl 4-hydroxylase
MWAQRYNASGHYRHHYDWTGSLARGGDRLSTFMVYLGADCEGGGTNFPRLRRPVGKAWCRFLECEDDDERENAGHQQPEGITFKPIKGNAIFWENLRADGTGYPETWHAAYPVTKGTKVGLNIWSWYQPPKRRIGR